MRVVCDGRSGWPRHVAAQLVDAQLVDAQLVDDLDDAMTRIHQHWTLVYDGIAVTPNPKARSDKAAIVRRLRPSCAVRHRSPRRLAALAWRITVKLAPELVKLHPHDVGTVSAP